MYKNLTRRNLLASLGGTSAIHLLSPFIPRVEAAEADGTIKRYTYWHEFTMPKPEIVDANYQAKDGPLRFRNDYAPLNKIANKIIFVRKMERPQGQKEGGGVHADGCHGITGWRTVNGGKYNPKATSIDQFLAQRLNGVTLKSDIRAGFKNTGRANDIDISQSVIKGKPQVRYKEPINLYNAIFKNLTNSSSDPNAANVLRRRKSVLDFIYQDMDKIAKKVSYFDRERIDAHANAIRSVEKQLEKQLGGEVSCNGVSSPGGPFGLQEDKCYPAYAKLVTMALKCDLTRVAGMNYGGATSNLTYAFLSSHSGDGNYHPATHGKNNGVNYIHDVLKFRAEQVTLFLTEMDSVVEPDGNTLLDNTIFTWFTEVARAHNTTKDIHCVMAGGKGRFKNQGQMVSVGSKDKYNQLLCSIAHFMGFDDVKGYGDPAYGGTGGLSSQLFV